MYTHSQLHHPRPPACLHLTSSLQTAPQGTFNTWACPARAAGVRSGTAVVDDMLMRRVEQQLLEVRRLMLEYEEAGEAVSEAAGKLTPLQLQHLQVGVVA